MLKQILCITEVASSTSLAGRFDILTFWHCDILTLWHCDIGKIVGPSSKLWVTRATPVASTVTVNRTLIPKSPSLTTLIIIFPRGLHFQILCNVPLWELQEQNFLFFFSFKKMFTFTFLRFAASQRRIPWADFDLLHSSLEASVQLWPSSIFGNIVTSLSLRSIKHWDQAGQEIEAASHTSCLRFQLEQTSESSI